MGQGPIAVVVVRDGICGAGSDEVVAEIVEQAAIRGDEPRMLVVGTGVMEGLEALTGLCGRVETCEVAEGPAGLAAALAPVVSHASIVLLAGSPDGRDLAPLIAAELHRPMLAGVVEIATEHVTTTGFGGMVSVLHARPGQFVATLQPGVRGVERPPSPSPPVSVPLPLEVVTTRSDARCLEVFPPDAATMDLAEAPRLVGGGAGLMSGDAGANFARLTAVGEALGASMGATRVVTDAGWVSHTRQIGTTGVVVDPRLYLAFAISGAVQHTAGLGHPEHVISVNTDPHCPMMAMADLAVVGDANATLAALARRLGLESPGDTGSGDTGSGDAGSGDAGSGSTDSGETGSAAADPNATDAQATHA